jgi:3'-(hydroxy)phthioceranyl-2'-palmitoyl(stearoyl)-2-O-sulfo-trehalose (hydroxy)phthioceranyltransferase
MKKLFVGAVAGMLSSATILGGGVAAGDETAFIVPGSAPSPYGPLRALYHFNTADQPAIGEKYYNSAGASRVIVPYPGSVWPVTGLDSPTVGESVAIGTNNLDSAVRSTSGPIVVTGLSQGTLVLDELQARLANDPNAPPPEQITFIKAGDPARLLAKIFEPGTPIPLIDWALPASAESQYNTIDIVGQYDPYSDPLERPGNLLADLNAVAAAGYYGHSATAFSDPARVAPEDVTVTTNNRGATTTTYFVRTDRLPLVRAIEDNTGLSTETAQRLDEILRPMVDAAYGPAPAQNTATPLNLPAVNIPALNAPAASAVGPAVSPATSAAPLVNAENVVNHVRGLLQPRR